MWTIQIHMITFFPSDLFLKVEVLLVCSPDEQKDGVRIKENRRRIKETNTRKNREKQLTCKEIREQKIGVKEATWSL